MRYLGIAPRYLGIAPAEDMIREMTRSRYEDLTKKANKNVSGYTNQCRV